MADIATLNQSKKIPLTVLCKELSVPRASYYRHQEEKTATHRSQVPVNALSTEQRQTVLNLLHSERFVDCTPYQTYYTLLDEGRYYCSIRSMYRVLEEQDETQDRRQQRNHRDAVKPELMATAPNQVWSWDITKLLSVQRLVYYYLYVIIDIFSRCVVGWLIADRECQKLARRLIHESVLKHAIQPGRLILHSDNGPSMTSHTVAQLLEHLGVLKTHNRPYTSNDNPFSESQFKTLKYCPTFPGRFESILQAEQFCQTFFKWYNKAHYHSGIAWLTPESVHYREANKILESRHDVLLKAYLENPVRFNHRVPKRKKLHPVYINPPETMPLTDLHGEIIMA